MKTNDAEAMAARQTAKAELEAVAESREKVGKVCESVCAQLRRSGMLLARYGLMLAVLLL